MEIVEAEQMVTDHPDLDPRTLAADGVLAVEEFYRLLFAELPVLYGVTGTQNDL
jgi:hypothetical protein